MPDFLLVASLLDRGLSVRSQQSLEVTGGKHKANMSPKNGVLNQDIRLGASGREPAGTGSLV
jgi:hypothetical protein